MARSGLLPLSEAGADSRCPSIVPELSTSSVYSRRLPSSDSSGKSLSLRVWSTGCDDGSTGFAASNPVGDAISFLGPDPRA